MTEQESGGMRRKKDIGLIGCELMGALLDNPNGTALVGERLVAMLRDDGPDALISSVIGVMNVATQALAELAEVTGTSEREHLQSIARRFVN